MTTGRELGPPPLERLRQPAREPLGEHLALLERGLRAVMQEALEGLVAALSPIVPHISHELWRQLGHADAVIDAPFPAVDAEALVADSVTLAVQVNGKLRGQIQVAAGATQEQIIEAALADAGVRRFTEGLELKKKIVVPGKLVSFVV